MAGSRSPEVRTVAIIQARTGSTRLPEKVLADIKGVPMLQRVITRVQRAETVDQVVVATTTLARDDIVATLAEHLGCGVFRGDERDVLGRYVAAAREWPADMYVRITADCPLIDPGVIDRAVRSLRVSGYDFATNSVQRTFPKGLDVEVCWADVLPRCDRLFDSPNAREHVFWGIYAERPELFLIRHLKDDTDHSAMVWCVDSPADLAYVRTIYDDSADYRTLIERCEARTPA